MKNQDRDKIEKYLLHDMSGKDLETFENDLLADEELFYETAERENDLVDAYVRGELDAATGARFEQTFDKVPTRKQKIDNARVIREFIGSERKESKTITIAERSGLLSKLGNIFPFGSPGLQFASIALMVLFAAAAGWLLVENRRLTSLETDLAAARNREADLVAEAQSERETAGDLTADLSAERERIERLEDEIAKLKHSEQTERPDRPAPAIATLLLSPIGIRGGGPKRLDLPAGVTRVAISVGIGESSPRTETVSVRLNGETVGSNLKVRKRGESRSVSLNVLASRFKSGPNEIAVVGSDGAVVESYSVLLAEPR